jgi:hypothetical protein
VTLAMLAADLREAPFAHTTHAAPIAGMLCEAALEWMEATAPWRLRIASFYEQWEHHLEFDKLPAVLKPLLAPGTVEHLIRLMFRPLGAANLPLTEATAHKLLPGQTIRVHNDYLADGETHRLLIQLNRGWADDQGGLLMLFGSSSPEDVQRILRPTHQSAMAFGISPESLHAVSTIKAGERYTLVYSFRAAGG